MNQINLGKTGLLSSEIALGCMRMAEVSAKSAIDVIQSAYQSGITLFDHADIYGAGKSETIFAEAFQQVDIKREDILLQSKCGIRKGYFDFSKDHIIAFVNDSLARLKTDYLDILLLHRPDTLFDEEVAEAFDNLERTGKVRYFGVSNQKPLQIELLQKYVTQKLIINQLQFSITNTGMIDSGFNVNMTIPASIDHDDSILEYCRLNDISIQAWSPFQHGFFEGTFLDNPKFPLLNQKIDVLAKLKNVTNSAIAIAWILRHPAKIQPIIGSMNPKRIQKITEASKITITRQEWYEIYLSAGNVLP